MKKKTKRQITGSNSKYSTNISFLDIMMNIILAFVIMFILAFIQINAKNAANIESKAEVLLILTWPDMADEDLDLWLKLPNGKTVSFTNKDVSYAHLERDDRGISGDIIYKSDGTKNYIRLNKEVITLRALVPGTYTVNVHYYSNATANDLEPNVVTVKPPYNARVTLARINPAYKELEVASVPIEFVGVEKTAFSFTITPELEIKDISHEQVPFVLHSQFQGPQ
jgi:hypothetical protein